ncbi:3-isopropylmalate dehydratase [uncultured Ilyobacter sp.]|uniref:LeuD/DmdB family oxidoreductase small subunit n=1 Tax=uncultured Ilyobacter sp. TaxID=544433 RepID=UPI0029C8E0DF|nr:3-isopropylmalate dehydratase [uncultured Ilyobacter sp.]
MSDIIRGKVYVLGDDIDTDQIIPASHLVYRVDDPEESKLYGKYALSGLPTEIKKASPFVKEGEFTSEYTVVIAGKNFGCGSSREHAPLCLEKAGVKAVIAESYARIFYRNAIDGAFLIPYESEAKIFDKFSTGDEIELDGDRSTIKNVTTGEKFSLKSIGDAYEIVKAGGIFKYAKNKM